jgi:tetratricopeptide (TPR) repeat protein/predicted aspartyl protease
MMIRSMVFVLTAMALAALGAPAAAAKCQLQKVAETPVTMVGLRPMISAKVNGVDVRLFIDTGSFFSTLNPATVRRIGMPTEALPPYIQVRGLTGQADMRLTTAHEFGIMGAELHRQDFLVAEHSLGADGLIGQELLARYDVEYDFANGVMRLFLPKDCDRSAILAYWDATHAAFIPIEPIEPPSNHIVGPASINGKKIHVLFDTGTPRSGMTLAAAKRAGVRTDGPGVVSAGTGQGVGRYTISTWLAPFDSFEIGGEQVKGTKLRVADFEIGDADMLLGTDFFLSHHILVSRSQDRLYFTYNGGPVFNLEQRTAPPFPVAAAATPADNAAASLSPETPKSFEDFDRRAAASVARREYEPAIADYTQAMALAPNDVQTVFDRGVARLLNHQPVLAMGDFDQALKLKPDDVPALMMRGDLRLAIRDEAGAHADFDAALKRNPNVAARVGAADARAGLYQVAIADYDGWIASHPKDEDLAGALAARCRARTMLGADLDKALHDCNDALNDRPGDADYLAARGLVKLRLGQLDPALGDFNGALRSQPKTPWALYGRGVIELRKGDKDRAAADLAAAAALAPRLADQAAKAGIKP